MATIKEHMHKEFWETKTFGPPAKAFEQGFEAGANFVLSEIKTILSDPINYVVDSGWQGQLNDVVGMIRQRIKELRGE